MFSVFFQTDYDLYVNHMMASHDMVKHTAHNVFNIDVNKTKKTWDTDVTLCLLFPVKSIDKCVSWLTAK